MPPTVQPTQQSQKSRKSQTYADRRRSCDFGGPTCVLSPISQSDLTSLLAVGTTLRRSARPCNKDWRQVERVRSRFSAIGELAKALLKFAAVCAEPAYAILPILFSASTD